jgi:nucleoside-diphosphate-sugar epimerase
MSGKLNLVTGATGLLGSHIAEKLVARGERVRALARPTSDTRFLQDLGVEIYRGDLGDVASIRRAVAGTDVVYHCAAKVGDWGPWKVYEANIVTATRNLFQACADVGVGRVLHVSSIAVYGHPRLRSELFTEDEPRGQNLWLWDNYCRAKCLAEEIAWHHGGPTTVVRPSWIYGPRDRVTVPRVVAALRAGGVSTIGTGENRLNIIYAGDVADGAILAASHPDAVGQAYHLSSAGEVTQRALGDVLTTALGLAPITRRIPFRLAFWGAFALEALGRVLRRPTPPTITRHVISLLGRPTRFSIEKARTRLGWQPRVGVEEGLRRSLEWLRETEKIPVPA